MHTKRYKVLHIIYDMSTAGAQTVVMNLLRNMKDDSLFDVSLLIRDRAKKTEYETELTSEGYNVVYSGYEPTGKYGIFRPVINWIRCQKAIYKAGTAGGLASGGFCFMCFASGSLSFHRRRSQPRKRRHGCGSFPVRGRLGSWCRRARSPGL